MSITYVGQMPHNIPSPNGDFQNLITQWLMDHGSDWVYLADYKITCCEEEVRVAAAMERCGLADVSPDYRFNGFAVRLNKRGLEVISSCP